MNIRSLYLIVIVLSSLGLLYEWNSDQKNQSIEDHLSSVKSSEYIKNPDYILIENDLLSLVISISSGSIIFFMLAKALAVIISNVPRVLFVVIFSLIMIVLFRESLSATDLRK